MVSASEASLRYDKADGKSDSGFQKACTWGTAMYDLLPEHEGLFFRMSVIVGRGSGLYWRHYEVNQKKFLAVVVLNFLDGIRHIVFIIPKLTADEVAAISAQVDFFETELSLVEMRPSAHLDARASQENSNTLPFSLRIFFFTDRLLTSPEAYPEFLQSTPRRLVLVDDEEWNRRVSMQKPDVFISHDSRDKDALARPLAHTLAKLGLVVWFDEFSLRPGDRLSVSIDRGLTECRHGVLLVTDNFLENSTWASTEMSALLTRAVDEPLLLIPVWSGISKEQVKSRSARLADIVALHETGNIEQLASKIFAVVSRSEPQSSRAST